MRHACLSFQAVQPYIKNPEFNAELIMSKSAAAAGLCAWVINIVKFYDVYVVVEPKRRALNAANAELQSARDKLAFLTDQIHVSLSKVVIYFYYFSARIVLLLGKGLAFLLPRISIPCSRRKIPFESVEFVLSPLTKPIGRLTFGIQSEMVLALSSSGIRRTGPA